MDDNKAHLRPRAILRKEQAIEIFDYKKQLGDQSWSAASSILVNKYNVNPKTIRDIWSGRSWLEVTCPQWQQV